MPVKQVVDSFVEHEAFAKLRKPVNTLLSGPRGSGKTTLMKMLQPIALELWHAKDAPAVSEEIPYTGVFIATDRTWKQQLEPHIRKGNPFAPELRAVANGAFAMHVLREIILSMQYQLSPPGRGPVRRSRAAWGTQEHDRFAMNVARVVKLEHFEPSLDGLVDALTIRLAELRSVQTAIRDGRSFPLPPWVIQVEALAVAEAVIQMFNRATGQQDHQWALLFDEMELAPTDITTSLLDAMRGQPQNILLKLSLSPVQPELSVLHFPQSGVHGQDFELIQLNYAHQRESLKFGQDLLMSEIGRRSLPYESKVSILGKSLFSSIDEGAGGQDRDDISSRRNNPYARTSSLWKRFYSLAQTDESFRNWLMINEVDLNGLDGLSATARAAKLRKVRNLVVVRQHYRSAASTRRSRKSYELYTGADTILAFCDGNARLLTALIGQLLGNKAVIERGHTLSASLQGLAVDSIIKRFFALVYAAASVQLPSGGEATLADLIHRIGDALAYGVVEATFRDNVPLSFTVDRRISPSVIRLLQSGLNVGAFIHIPKRPDYHVPLDLQGEQFRLTWVLAPYFGLPVRMGPPIALSTLLSRPRREGGRIARTRLLSGLPQFEGQISLFGDQA